MAQEIFFVILNKMDFVICHYHEIGLKGKNRRFFEKKLVENIKRSLGSASFEFVKRISGRIIVKLTKKGKENEKEIKENIKKVFGIAYSALAVSCPQKIKNIQEKALELLRDKKFKTFKIATKRSKKEFSLTSPQINERVGAYVLKKLKTQKPRLRQGLGSQAKIKVDLENPDVTCFIEIVENYAFLYLEKIRGQGGLPISASGKAVSLLSGGIDSPVASFLAMKRGVKVIFLHFHAYPFASKASIEKAIKIVRILSDYQGKSKLYLIPFADIQKEILMKTQAKLRVILYRRFMLKIAEEIAKREKALGIFTGESIGQVASQTLENIKVIEETIELPVFRPLISQDKEEIIQKAKEIGTFDVSILPHQDCCSRFLPKHPETKSRVEDILKTEKKLNIEKLVKEAVKNSSVQIV